MSYTHRSWIANFSFWVHLLNIQAFSYGRNLPPSRFVFPDKNQDQFVKTLQDFQVVSPARVDSDGHFLSYNLRHHASNFRRKRDFRKKDSQIYYKIRHQKKELFFNLTLHQELLSNNYILEKRHGSYLGAKVIPSVDTSCHLIGMVLDSDSRNGKAAISTCNGLDVEIVIPSRPLKQVTVVSMDEWATSSMSDLLLRCPFQFTAWRRFSTPPKAPWVWRQGVKYTPEILKI